MSFTGYDPNKEDVGYLNKLADAGRIMKYFAHLSEARFDPRELIQVESQGSVGSCQGHSLSSVLEWCALLATGGVKVQLSRAMAYYETQRIDGIRGDSGSTISGGIKLATTIGLCLESLWKYTGRYNPARPSNWQEIITSAANYKAGTALTVKEYATGRTFLGNCLGGIHTGISWGGSMSAGVVETFRPGMGGHSICALCLSDRVDKKGEPYWWILNSWGEGFGSREYGGWQEWSPTAIRQMLQHRFTHFVAVSEMPNLKPRDFERQDWIKSLRLYDAKLAV